MKEFDSDKGNNISYYEKTAALKKNSVIDRLLIDRMIAEKKEEYAKQARSPTNAVGSLGDNSGKPRFDGSVTDPHLESLEDYNSEDEMDATVIAGVQGNLSIAGRRAHANTSTLNRSNLDKTLDETRLDQTMAHNQTRIIREE